MSDMEKMNMIMLKAQGYTIEAIAIMYNCSVEQIKRYFETI